MARKPSSRKKLPNFEDSLQQLEAIVENLEQGEQSLEDALGQFEQGITLARHCQKTLDDAEQKVHILLEEDDKETLAPLDKVTD